MASDPAASDPWTIPPEQRPACPLDGHPCSSWTCLVDVCVDDDASIPARYQTPDAQRIRVESGMDTVRATLEALCRRDGLSLDSAVVPNEPARNYELALRLGIGQVFGIGNP